MGRSLSGAIAVVICGVLTTGGPARSELCTIDTVPAATLLLPYFAVDVSRRSAPDTLFSINNASAAPTIAQVTLWTEDSFPVTSFPIFLTGYDIETISLRELFAGKLPSGTDPGCVLPSSAILGKAKGRRAKGRNLTQLAAKFLADRTGAVAEGYVTIDNASEDCSTFFPNQAGYFVNGGTGVANNFNQLYGQVYVSDKKQLSAHNLVSIEASTTGSSLDTAGNYTFYGRYFGFDARDNREPLYSTWSARYFNSSKAKTYLRVWRDSGPFAQPLSQTQVVFFDTEETAFEPDFEERYFPFEAQEVEIGRDLPTPFDEGWVYLNLNHDNAVLQSFVVIRQDFKKRSSLLEAVPHNDPQSGGPETVTSICGPAPDGP